MAKVFAREKFEQIKTEVEVARAASGAANDDRHFYREAYQKQAAWFKRTYKRHNRLARADATNSVYFFQAEFGKITKIIDDQSAAKHHLEELFLSLLEHKSAERRCIEARDNLNTVAGCFGILEDFARKHIKNIPTKHINAMSDNSFYGSAQGGFANGE